MHGCKSLNIEPCGFLVWLIAWMENMAENDSRRFTLSANAIAGQLLPCFLVRATLGVVCNELMAKEGGEKEELIFERHRNASYLCHKANEPASALDTRKFSKRLCSANASIHSA